PYITGPSRSCGAGRDLDTLRAARARLVAFLPHPDPARLAAPLRPRAALDRPAAAGAQPSARRRLVRRCVHARQRLPLPLANWITAVTPSRHQHFRPDRLSSEAQPVAMRTSA